MKTLWLAAPFVVGMVIALHFSMNAAIGKIVGNPRMGNAVFWLIGAGMAVLIALSGWDRAFWTRARTAPLWLWFAGAIGACIVFAVISFIPRLGAGTTNVILLTGQVIGGLLIAHYGLLGSPVERFTLVRMFGVLLMIAGASFAVLGRIPFLR
ncbi:MAG: DMT family transporter [Candidatus Latescibacteria bacterium]|nr:DMT family transporter [Candidatus Latescibacterota bacterium]